MSRQAPTSRKQGCGHTSVVWTTSGARSRLAGPEKALRITGHQANQIDLADAPALAALRPEASAAVHVRLQQPFVDPHRCIGCGVCQHECPVRGRAAIRVTSENETRSRAHALLAGTGLPQTKE